MMTGALASNIMYIVFLIFFGYFVLLMLFYFFLVLVGFAEGKKRSWESAEENYPFVYFSSANIPVSIIMPARNEEGWIRDSLLSALNLNYPEFEIIMVDDGSTDRTFDILDEILELRSIDIPYIKHYPDGKVRQIFKSVKHSNVTVIRKYAGTKKAGAVNAGMNLAKYNYICPIDADTILEPDSILKVMAHVAKDPERIIGIGSYFGLSNGLKIKDGRVIEKSFSYNPFIAYQNLEYIHSFIGKRIGWSKFNAMPIVAGGFGIWRRDVIYELGGFSIDFTCEDIELTFRAHDYMARNKDKDYRIVMLPYYVAWTEGPQNLKSLISQRSRWQRVTNETVWTYKYMLFNPKYKGFGFLVLPYFIIYEVLGAYFELLSIIMVLIGWLGGLLDTGTFLAFLIFMILLQGLFSLSALFAFVRSQRLFKLRYLCYMIILSLVEFFWYKWIISIAKLSGTFDYLRKVKAFNQYSRVQRT